MVFVPSFLDTPPADWVRAYPLSPYKMQSRTRRKQENPKKRAQLAFEEAVVKLVKKLGAETGVPSSSGASALIQRLRKMPFLLFSQKSPALPESLNNKNLLFVLDEARRGPLETCDTSVLLPPPYQKICLPFDPKNRVSFIPLRNGTRFLLREDGSLLRPEGVVAEKLWRDFYCDAKDLQRALALVREQEARQEIRDSLSLDEQMTPFIPRKKKSYVRGSSLVPDYSGA